MEKDSELNHLKEKLGKLCLQFDKSKYKKIMMQF